MIDSVDSQCVSSWHRIGLCQRWMRWKIQNFVFSSELSWEMILLFGKFWHNFYWSHCHFIILYTFSNREKRNLSESLDFFLATNGIKIYRFVIKIFVVLIGINGIWHGWLLTLPRRLSSHIFNAMSLTPFTFRKQSTCQPEWSRIHVGIKELNWIVN